MLKLYNTLTRKKEEFKPIKKGEVRMYVCGPTVNDVPHLGHARQQITFDILRKILKYNGLKVKFVSNITDVDDKIINRANELGKDIKELTKENTKIHLDNYKSLNVDKPDVQPKATEYIKEMVALVKKLEEKGYTYIIGGDGVYYDISKFRNYGKLSHQNIEDLKAGARVAAKDLKKNKEDFVLWKFSKTGEPQWDSPWGKGRPGWHIECSAMSESILGIPFDIHGGGQDLIFPHHEDEIAQTEAAFGKKMANYWVHNGMVNIGNVKMSKSLGNFRTISDLFKEYEPGVIRYFVLLAHYKTPVDFAEERIDAAKTSYERIKRKIIELKKKHHKGGDMTKEYEGEFLEAINNDLNTSKALQIFIKALDDFEFDTKKKLILLGKFDEVLGLGVEEMREEKIKVPSNIQKLIKEREKLRKNKKWAESDVIRERIKEKGYLIKDTPQGPHVEKA
jgi:cysteinyl-tRNA synthetase